MKEQPTPAKAMNGCDPPWYVEVKCPLGGALQVLMGFSVWGVS